MSLVDAKERIEEFRESDETELDLSFLELNELPASLFAPEIADRLNFLDLKFNALSKLPDRLFDLTALTSLDVGGNNLTELPDRIGDLTALTSLDMDGNNLTELPDRIGDLTALTSLDVGRNNLTTLPNRLFELTALTSLFVADNNLTALPDRLFDLTALTSLNVGGNNLMPLSDRFERLIHLDQLFIYRTGLTALPDWIGRLPALREIDLEGLDLKGENLSRFRILISDLSETNLEGANIQGLDLQETAGLTQDQLDSAIGDASTLIPGELERPAHWEDDGGEPEEVAEAPPPEIPDARPAPIRTRIEGGQVVLDASEIPETATDREDIVLHRRELLRDADHILPGLGNAGGLRRRLTEYRDALGADTESFNELLLGLRGEAFASAVQRAEEELLGDVIGDLEGLVAKHQIFMRHFPKWLAHVAPDAADELTEEIVEQTKTAFDAILQEMALEEELFDPQIAKLLKSFEEAAESFKGFARNQWRGAYRGLENVLNSLARFALEFGNKTRDQLLEIGPKRAAQFIVAISGAGLTALITSMASSFGWLAPVVAYLTKLLG